MGCGANDAMFRFSAPYRGWPALALRSLQKTCAYSIFPPNATECDIKEKVKAMHKLSLAIADACVARGWIPAQKQPWCAYAVEKKLLSAVFFSLLTVLALLLGKLPETAIFAGVFYFLRRRYGGWHAPYAWLCQLISISLMLGAVLLAGPAAMEQPAIVVWVADVLVMSAAFLQRPVYPPQVHFDAAIKQANHQKKNQILWIVAALQLGIGPFYREMLVYSLLGVLAGILSVYIELVQQCIKKKGRET